MKKGIIALCLLCSISGVAQETTKLTAGKHNEYGLIYSLPNTVFDIEVIATQTITKPDLIINMLKNILVFR